MRLMPMVMVAAATLGAAGCEDHPQVAGPRGQVQMSFLHTSDIHSRLFPYDFQIGQIDASLGLGEIDSIASVGGAARISHIIGRERARSERVLHLDGGDCFQGAPVFNFFAGEAEIRVLSAMGADGMIVANHEFDRGALNLGTQLQNWANFPVLVANYHLEDPSQPGASPLGSVVQPYQVFDLAGLKVGVIGMGNLSSLSSIYEQPNRLGILPMQTVHVAQFYTDLLRPMVDLVVFVTHLGLNDDQRMIEQTEGIDVVLGGHNHVVLQPPKRIRDCANVDAACEARCRQEHNGDEAANEACVREGCHYVELVSGEDADPATPTPPKRRRCVPREVVLVHSGAFAKFVGRLDAVLSNDQRDFTGPRAYQPLNGFEVLSFDYKLFAVNAAVPEDPIVRRVLEPFEQKLDLVANLNTLVGYAPEAALRFSPSGGDSALGNLIASAMWLRLGIQTDFALTNTLGIRANVVPGPLDIEQMYNIFPFDNSIAKMQLSGVEVQEVFDFAARRSASRGCSSQIQVAGARVVMDCVFQERGHSPGKAIGIYVGAQACEQDSQCAGNCDEKRAVCTCASDADCGGHVGSCDTQTGICWKPIVSNASYEMATSNYLAGGGSGFRMLQRNTTQFDTKIQQRDALIDFIRAGRPCGSNIKGELAACAQDSDCQSALGDGYVCACREAAHEDLTCSSDPQSRCNLAAGVPGPGDGACVLARCRTDVADLQRARCERAPTFERRQDCLRQLTPCASGGEQCKFLSCVDGPLGTVADGRLKMVGK